MARKPARKANINMTELCKIVNREPGTIRGWEHKKLLPKHLMPARDLNNHRYWTHEQVHGPKGIIAWMDDNDMRPGKLVADPSKEDQHVNNLRKPKLLNGDQLRGVQMMIDNGRDREYILRNLFPRTKYSTITGLESALVRYYKTKGLYFPPKKRRPYPTRAQRMERARLTGTPLYTMSEKRKQADEVRGIAVKKTKARNKRRRNRS